MHVSHIKRLSAAVSNSITACIGCQYQSFTWLYAGWILSLQLEHYGINLNVLKLIMTQQDKQITKMK